MLIENPINLAEFCAEKNIKMEYTAFYWGGDGKFIDYRPEYGRKIPYDGKFYDIKEFEVLFAEESHYGDWDLTIGFTED